MRRAAARLVGKHDLASFAGGGEGVPWSERHTRPRGAVRRVVHCDCRTVEPAVGWFGSADGGQLFEVRVVADGFLPRMVRNIVGALVEVGRGARTDAWIDDLLTARDRRCGPKAAPPHGLILWRVGYGDDTPDHVNDAPHKR
jgi:tRNA pseudouridine38-40 synthase